MDERITTTGAGTVRMPGRDGGDVVVVLGRPERARAALRAGVGLGAALGVPVRAVHVHDGPVEDVRRLAVAADVPLTQVGGDASSAIDEAGASGEATVAVLAADAWDDDRLLHGPGDVLRSVVERSSRPVLVVPTACSPRDGAPPRRVLVPHDGSAATTGSVESVLAALRDEGLEVVVLHVFDPDHVPACVDHPYWGIDSWSHEFLHRFADADRDLVLRAGEPADHVVAGLERHDPDLVLVGWSRDLSPGRATVVRRLLREGTVPVLLVPVARPAAAGEPTAGVLPVATRRG